VIEDSPEGKFAGAIAARDALIASSKRANDSLSTFNGWLLGATGAAFAAAVSALDFLEKFVPTTELKLVLSLALCSLLVGSSARLVFAMVSAGVASAEDGAAIGQRVADGPFSLTEFVKQYQAGLLPPVSWLSSGAIEKAKTGDVAVGARRVAGLSQCSALLLLGQVGLILGAGFLLVASLNIGP
jgi:hypothetical protein